MDDVLDDVDMAEVVVEDEPVEDGASGGGDDAGAGAVGQQQQQGLTTPPSAAANSRRPPRPPATAASSAPRTRTESQTNQTDDRDDAELGDAGEASDPAVRWRVEMALRNRRTWIQSQKSGPYWAFYVPRDPNPPDVDEQSYRGGNLHVECFMCHAAKSKSLHSEFPTADQETRMQDEQVAFWAPPRPVVKDGSEAKHDLFYKSQGGNNSLRRHVRTYHYEELQQVVANLNAAGSTAASTGGAISENTQSKQDTDNTLKTHFKSTKRLKTGDARVSLFWRMLAILVVFCCLPFSIVENPFFQAFVWFLDATMPLPSRSKLCNELLPTLAAKGRQKLKQALKGVRGVALTFDLWMSRKTEDNLSLDVHFIDTDWIWRHYHIGIISCKDSSTGEDIAPRIEPALKEFDLCQRVIAVVKDGGGNLATATRVLVRQGLCCCAALKLAKPYITLCFGHKINGACNAAVLLAKAMTGLAFSLKAIIEKLQSCITWTKKSSKGWSTFRDACTKMGQKITKFITPVKTRFTSTWKMLAGLLMKRKVIDYLYGDDEVEATAHLRSRKPEHSEWKVAGAVEGVLKHPCSVVTKSQSQNSHWLLPDAIASVSKLSVELRAKRATPAPPPPPDIAPEDIDPDLVRFDEDIKKMTDAMITRILDDVDDMLEPFYAFKADRGHEVMATMLDPRYAGGVIFMEALTAKLGNKDTAKAKAIALLKRYKEEVLYPALMKLHCTMEDEARREHEEARTETGGAEGAARTAVVDDLDLMRDDQPTDAAAQQQLDEQQRLEAVKAEWSRYLDHASKLRKSGGFEKGMTVLGWWRAKKHLFPLVAELARLLLCIPASQIECERIFSLAGLVTQHLRNRMGVEMMSTQVFIRKNVDPAAEIADILNQAYGPVTYKATVEPMVNIPTQLQEARRMAAAVEEDIPASDLPTSALDLVLADSEQQLKEWQQSEEADTCFVL